jgi:hypothetical protein
MKSTADELIDCFEQNLASEKSFHHADHLRLAFEYLRAFSVLEALSRFSAGLKRFAAASGKTQFYNETITFAYFFLIRERMARNEGVTWEEFAESNADLLVWKDGTLSRYYREATLKSDFARNVFVLPDFALDPELPDKDMPQL